MPCCTGDSRAVGTDVDVTAGMVNENTGKSSLYVYDTSKKELQELILPANFSAPVDILTEAERDTGLVTFGEVC